MRRCFGFKALVLGTCLGALLTSGVARGDAQNASKASEELAKNVKVKLIGSFWHFGKLKEWRRVVIELENRNDVPVEVESVATQWEPYGKDAIPLTIVLDYAAKILPRGKYVTTLHVPQEDGTVVDHATRLGPMTVGHATRLDEWHAQPAQDRARIEVKAETIGTKEDATQGAGQYERYGRIRVTNHNQQDIRGAVLMVYTYDGKTSALRSVRMYWVPLLKAKQRIIATEDLHMDEDNLYGVAKAYPVLFDLPGGLDEDAAKGFNDSLNTRYQASIAAIEIARPDWVIPFPEDVPAR